MGQAKGLITFFGDNALPIQGQRDFLKDIYYDLEIIWLSSMC